MVLTHNAILPFSQTYLEKIAEQYEVDWQPTIKLSTEQMIEPMAAPIGYSVQAAQGSGLQGTGTGPVAQTGVQNTDEDINFQKQQNSWIPPPAPGHDNSTQHRSRSIYLVITLVSQSQKRRRELLIQQVS